MADLELIKIIDLDPVQEFLPGLLTIVSDDLGNTKKATIGQFRDWITNAPLIVNGTGTTPPNGDNSIKLATTQYVQNTVSGLGLGVATNNAYGTVRTNTTDPVPVVYLKSEVDTLNNAVRPIAAGGTGANTATLARTALGAAVNGINSDITQLTALAAIPALIQAAIDAVYKPGMVILSASGNIPTGWLECNGQQVNRVTYAALFAEIGTTYGSGNGSTTFTLPKMQGRFPMGEGTSDQGSGRFRGLPGGSESALLAVANMPSHAHSGNTTGAGSTLNHFHSGFTALTGGHGHSTDSLINNNTATGGTFARVVGGGGTGAFSVNSAGEHTHTVTVTNADRSLDHTHQINAEGSGSAFGVLNPFQVFKFLIKI